MKTPVRQLKTQAGFSLIELMIVVAIIGILASIAVPNFQKFQRRAKQTEGKGYLSAIYSAENGFRAEWNSYTTDLICIGFRDAALTANSAQGIAGRGQYVAGFSADGGLTAGGTTCTTGNNLAFPQAAAGATLASAVADTTTVSSPTAFLAGTTGNLKSSTTATDLDNWTLDQNKQLTNTQSGL